MTLFDFLLNIFSRLAQFTHITNLFEVSEQIIWAKPIFLINLEEMGELEELSNSPTLTATIYCEILTEAEA